MSELPFKPVPEPERCYGEMRCRRYLFDRAAGEAPPPSPQPPRTSGERPGWPQ